MARIILQDQVRTSLLNLLEWSGRLSQRGRAISFS